MLENQECDIIYKLKNKEIYFLIEHQTKIDYSMPLRISQYENEIMKSAINKKRVGKKEYKIPRVITIVLYSGRVKWNVSTDISRIQERLTGYIDIGFGQYHVVDVNNFSEKELLKEESFLAKAMLIEKTRDTEALTKYLERIVKEINDKKDMYTKEQKSLLIIIIDLVLRKKLDNVVVEELIKRVREEEEKMLAVLEMIEKENKALRATGERKGIRKNKIETAKRMLARGMDIKTIMEITELSEKKIRNIKK